MFDSEARLQAVMVRSCFSSQKTRYAQVCEQKKKSHAKMQTRPIRGGRAQLMRPETAAPGSAKADEPQGKEKDAAQRADSVDAAKKPAPHAG